MCHESTKQEYVTKNKWPTPGRRQLNDALWGGCAYTQTKGRKDARQQLASQLKRVADSRREGKKIYCVLKNHLWQH